MQIVCIANQKGGTGKTTTTDALASWLKARGARVLAVDMDAQCNLTASYGKQPTGATVGGVLVGDIDPLDAITKDTRTDLIKGTELLDTGADIAKHLKRCIHQLAPLYDFMVIDTAPALTRLSVAVMRAADILIVPTTGDAFGLAGLGTILRNWQAVKAKGGRAAVLLTKHSGRQKLAQLARAHCEQIATDHGALLAKTAIRDAVAVREAQTLGRSLFDHAPRSTAAQDYAAAFTELFNTTEG